MRCQCANCENTGELHEHHIVPKALGGTENPGNKVMLCIECHGLIHGRNMVRHRELQRAAMERLKSEGKSWGRPCISINNEFIIAHKRWRNKEINSNCAIELSGYKRSTFFSMVKHWEQCIAEEPEYVSKLPLLYKGILDGTIDVSTRRYEVTA